MPGAFMSINPSNTSAASIQDIFEEFSLVKCFIPLVFYNHTKILQIKVKLSHTLCKRGFHKSLKDIV